MIKKILLVDNDSINNYIIQRLIKTSLKFSVKMDICFNEREASNYILNSFGKSEENFPDVILLDTSMQNVELFLSNFNTIVSKINKKTKLYITSWSVNIEEEEDIYLKKYDCISGLLPKPLYIEHLEQMFIT
jgi:hypothetical protein